MKFYGILFSVVIIVCLFFGVAPNHTTNEILQRVADNAKCENTDTYVSNKTDWWGNKVVVYRVVSTDIITYRAVSAGSDGVVGTKDDLECVAIKVKSIFGSGNNE